MLSHTYIYTDTKIQSELLQRIEDHKILFRYLTRWIEASAWFDTNQRVCKTLFLERKEFLVYEKKYAPTTVNVRLV